MEKYQLGAARLAGSAGSDGRERVILYTRGRHLDLTALVTEEYAQDMLGKLLLLTMLREWDAWRERLPVLIEHAFARGKTKKPLAAVASSAITWLPPVSNPPKLICIGTNYTDHIAEMSANMGAGKPWPRPEFPYSFLKPGTTTLVGDGATIRLPRYAQFIDWEVELAVVIGKTAHEVVGEAALAATAGYSVFNDVSVRDFVTKPASVGIDWVMSKAFDGSSPMGPYLTPAEFIPDPQRLRLRLRVNGIVKQDSTTANLVFGVREIIEHLSSIMTLEPGDIIATGTPAGVGFGRRPQERLHPGDVMVAEIEGLGQLTTRVEV